MSQCKIFLDNYTGVYYAGSQISGRVECYFDSETKIRAIKIRVKCDEHNSWTGSVVERDPQTNRDCTRYVTFCGENRPFFKEQVLFSGASDTVTVPSGRHVYPFEISVPFNIPTSFNGPYGAVCYSVDAIVDRPLRMDYKDSFIFVLRAPIDFNRLSKDLQNPVNYEDEKTICCWCCAGGHVSMCIELPKSGFAVGETVDFTVKLTNMSNNNVERIKCTFTKQLEYKVHQPQHESKYDTQVIQKFNEHGVGAHGDHTYNLQLQIPPDLEVPNFEACVLFVASYKLEFTCELSGMAMDLDIVIWPTLGHIQCSGSMAPGAQGGYPPAPPAYPSYPPASAPGYPPAGGASYPAGPGFTGGAPAYPTLPGYPPASGYNEKGDIGLPAAPSAPAPYNEQPPPSYDQAQNYPSK